MTMPQELILIRHGESEGNVAKNKAHLQTPEFLERHSSSWRLTDTGRMQAKITGAWLRKEIEWKFRDCVYYVSPYLRARETATLLELPNVRWREEPHLRERNWGDLEPLTEEQRKQQFSESLRLKKTEPFYWCPPNGESIVQVCETRVYRFLTTLHREHEDKTVVVVLHGELMWAFRIALERMSPERYKNLDLSKDPLDRIHNCQILQYSRYNPEREISEETYHRMRSVCPSDLSKSRNQWETIIRPTYSNEDLLALVEQTPRLING